MAADQGATDVNGPTQQEQRAHKNRAAREYERDRKQAIEQAAHPQSQDAVDPRMCRRCGLIQNEARPHTSAAICIIALRDRLAWAER